MKRAGAMTIYLAGASADIDRVETLRDELIAAGHSISHDWTADVRALGNANHGLTREQREHAADSCLAGVRACSVFVLLMPPNTIGTIGAWVEYGFALGERKRVIVVDDDERSVMTAALVNRCQRADLVAVLKEIGVNRW